MKKVGDLVLIECATCEAKVSAEILSLKEEFDAESGTPSLMLFLECKLCGEVMLGYSELVQLAFDVWDYQKPYRLWPKPKNFVSWKLPESVRESIEEAKICLQARAYSACAVMCGRALESVCKEHGIKNWKLQKGLQELKEKQVIDGRLYEWGEALRESRNIGAHANDQKISRDDANDILDFTIAICDYVYVLTDKYESFKLRQHKKSNI